MSHHDYLETIEFIKKNSGTDDEEKQRLIYWIQNAGQLVDVRLQDEECYI